MKRAAIDPLNPYGMGDSAPWTPFPGRTLPAKGTEVGVRDSRICGQISPRFGTSWMAAIVERLTPRALYVRTPRGVCVALDLADPWEIAAAASGMFWKRCWACHGVGMTVMPSSDFQAECTECGGWIDTMIDPFRR